MQRRTLLLAGASALTIAALGPLRAEDALKGKIVYARKDGDKYLLHVMDIDGKNDKELPGQTGASNIFPTWSPDGKRIAYMSGAMIQGREYKLSLINADGTGVKTIDTGEGLAGIPAWSPDGKHLAYTAGAQQPTIYLADADGLSASKFSEDGAGGIFPFFSRDSKYLCYTKFTEPQANAGIVRKPVAGGAAESFLPGAERLYYSTAGGLSPDGKKLAYMAMDMQNQAISLRVRTLDTASESFLAEGKITVADGPEGFSAVSWTPDGKWIIANIPTEKGMGVHRISEDGQTKIRLTPEGVDCLTPAYRGE
jgi:Tol biopolymer transport system component